MSAPVLARIRRLAVALCLPMVFLSGQIQAQEVPAVEVAAGYGVLHDAELEKTFPVGWLASVGWNVTDAFAIVGEVSGQHTRSDHESFSTVTVSGSCGFGGCLFGPPPDRIIQSVRIRGEQQLDVSTFVAGVRFVRRSARVTPFLHILVGAVRVRSDIEQHELHVDVLDPSFRQPSLPVLRDSVTTRTQPAVQVGGGVDFPVGARLSVRFATDYRRESDDFGRDLNQFRLSSGVVVGIGNR